MSSNINSNDSMGTWTLPTSGRAIPLWLYRRILYTFDTFATASPNGVREIVQLQFDVDVDNDMLGCVYRALITLPPNQLRRLRGMPEEFMSPRPGPANTGTITTRAIKILPFNPGLCPPRVWVDSRTVQRLVASPTVVIDLTQDESSEDGVQIPESQLRHAPTDLPPRSSNKKRRQLPGISDTVTKQDERESAKTLPPRPPQVQLAHPGVDTNVERHAREEVAPRSELWPWTSPPPYPETFSLSSSIHPQDPVSTVDTWRRSVLTDDESPEAQTDTLWGATSLNDTSPLPPLRPQPTLAHLPLPSQEHDNSEPLFIAEDEAPANDPQSLFIPEGESPEADPESLFIPEGERPEADPESLFIPEGELPEADPESLFIPEGERPENDLESLFGSEGDFSEAGPESLFIPEGETPDNESETLFIPEDATRANAQVHQLHVDANVPGCRSSNVETAPRPAPTTTENDVDDASDQEHQPLVRCEVD